MTKSIKFFTFFPWFVTSSKHFNVLENFFWSPNFFKTTMSLYLNSEKSNGAIKLRLINSQILILLFELNFSSYQNLWIFPFPNRIFFPRNYLVLKQKNSSVIVYRYLREDFTHVPRIYFILQHEPRFSCPGVCRKKKSFRQQLTIYHRNYDARRSFCVNKSIITRSKNHQFNSDIK